KEAIKWSSTNQALENKAAISTIDDSITDYWTKPLNQNPQHRQIYRYKTEEIRSL
ncbi:Hypothetical predicted protein, partial [Mytilus galloprovincialis]